jgi:hypothetical protein
MSAADNKSFAVSGFRRLVVDLMHFGSTVPSVTAERNMRLAPLVAARLACQPPPTWSTLFIKAFAIVAKQTPLLRTSYLKFPWPRFYEHSKSVATVNIDRQKDTERIVLWANIKRPENHSLKELDDIIRHHKKEPLETLKPYQRAVTLSSFPWPLRRWIWWLGLNMMGAIRCHNFGTFGISSVGAQGAGLTHMVPLLTAQLHYGIFDESGRLAMRLSFDHRVIDGAAAAQALADMEDVLLNEILQECRGTNFLRLAA